MTNLGRKSNWSLMYTPNGIQNRPGWKKCIWVPNPSIVGRRIMAPNDISCGWDANHTWRAGLHVAWTLTKLTWSAWYGRRCWCWFIFDRLIYDPTGPDMEDGCLDGLIVDHITIWWRSLVWFRPVVVWEVVFMKGWSVMDRPGLIDLALSYTCRSPTWALEPPLTFGGESGYWEGTAAGWFLCFLWLLVLVLVVTSSWIALNNACPKLELSGLIGGCVVWLVVDLGGPFEACEHYRIQAFVYGGDVW